MVFLFIREKTAQSNKCVKRTLKTPIGCKKPDT